MPVDTLTEPTASLTSAGSAPCELPAVRVDLRFEQIFQDFAPYVLRVLPRLGVRSADLDDVAQDVFVVVHRALPGFEGRSSVKTWVYGICIRVACNYRERAHRRYEALTANDSEQPDARTPMRELEAKRELVVLDAALSALPDTQRAVFVLHEVEQLSVQEIAAAMGCSRFTTYARLYAARKSVRAALLSAPESSHE